MRHSNSTLPALLAGLTLAALPLLGSADSQAPPASAQQAKSTTRTTPQKSVDRFTASTTAMTPDNKGLRINVLRWSDEEGRASVIEAIGKPDPTAALIELPTLGHVWLDSSPVGFSVKYAHREKTPDGGERITFVTEKRLDYYELKKWAPTPPVVAKDTGYGVVELYVDAQGQGTGTLSLAADVQVDGGYVSLADGAPRLLKSAKVEPKPYWEREQSDAQS